MLLTVAGAGSAQEQGKALWEEYDKLIDKRSAITALGPDLFGDNVDLYTGNLSFSATDVSVPGNNALPVAVGRRYGIDNHSVGHPGVDGYDLAFADWDLDVPKISGVFATTWHDQRCSGAAQPPAVQVSDKYFQPNDYWQGHNASLPGGGEMLIGSASTTRPANGGPWRWTTDGQTWFSCLATIKNGSGEGFLATTADGTRYWFDWMAQHAETPLRDKNNSGLTIYLPRRRNVLYATRVEDRFGNWVTYTYTNAYNARTRLTAINASDGRAITLGYNGDGHIASINDGSRTWRYEYAYVGSGQLKSTLTAVVLPDDSRWAIDFVDFSEAGFGYHKSREPGDFYRSCFDPGDAVNATPIVGSITHPAGATGVFTMSVLRHGRSNVPALCGGYSLPDNNPNDDVAYYPINWDAYTLSRKQVSGPGLGTDAWTYAYFSDISWFYPPSGGGLPVCQDSNGCQAPGCTDDNCAGNAVTTVAAPDGSWTRYTFGNSYRYNEGKLLKTQKGTGTTPLQTERIQYELAQSGQPYPTPIGISPQARGNAFTSEYLRPQKRRETVREGSRYINEVEQFDQFARPLRVRRRSFATGGFHVDPPAAAPALTAPASSTTGTYGLSWTSVGEATRYPLEMRVGAGSWSTVQDSSATTWSASGQGSGSYAYRVRACNEAGCSAYSATKTTQVTLPPASPPVVTAPASDNNGAYTVSWTSVAETTEYRLDQRKDGGSWSQVHLGPATSKAVSGLGDGTYDYRVRACNTAGCTGYSATDTTVVTHPPASTPVVTAPASDGDGAYTVTWTSVTSTTQYRLDQRKDGGSWSQVHLGPATSKAVSGLSNGSYDYRVRACNVGGCSAYSAIDTTVVLLPPAGTPTVTAPSSDNNGAFTVSWTSVSTAADYRLEQRKDSGSWSQIYSGTATSKAVSGLANGTYDYRVRACNSGGCGSYSSTDSTVVLLPPASAPTVTAPSSDNNGAYTVTWTGVSTANEYRLEQRKDGGSWSQIHAGTGTSKAVSGLTNGSYGYRARACNASGCSGYSAIKTTVVTHPPGSAPTLYAPSSANTNQDFTVSWTAVSTATSYELQHDASTGSWTVIYSGTGTYKVENYRFEREHTYRVRACNAGGCGLFSTIKAVYVIDTGGGNCGGGPCPEPLGIDPVSSQLLQTPPSEGEGQ
ncbi:wall associated protein [Lysobacter maris]|uniref:Wall associated protein n=2 Tax=Marilutibacter maris TaxID=1605891 RepID=A0A2U9T6B6_9GAMM|nr:wall associated protein [Lysobacter maris]